MRERLIIASVVAAACMLVIIGMVSNQSFDPVMLSEKPSLKKFWRSFWTPLTLNEGSLHAARRVGADQKDPLGRFFGLQHFPGTSLHSNGRTMKLHLINPLKHFFGLQSFDGSSLKITRPARIMDLHEVPNFDWARVPSKTGSDGYLDSKQYQQELTKIARSEQQKYIRDWKQKKMGATRSAIAGASNLFQKWTVVDPHTGLSRDDLSPYSTWGKKSRRMHNFHRSKAHSTMMFQVKADDNGKTYTLPWWCILYHQEATGSGQGLQGGLVPLGPSGQPGTDCTPPSAP